jgi:hypothetical protein
VRWICGSGGLDVRGWGGMGGTGDSRHCSLLDCCMGQNYSTTIIIFQFLHKLKHVDVTFFPPPTHRPPQTKTKKNNARIMASRTPRSEEAHQALTQQAKTYV